jgi:CBS domain containing-hemolysin-like protein
MSDQKDAQGSSAESNPDPASSGAAEREDGERQPSESWFDRLLTAVGLRSASLRRDLEEALGGDEADAAFSAEERTMLNNVLGLAALRVEDIMIPRADMLAVDIDAPLSELIAEFGESEHSRMPVYRETLDDPVGMVHIKDLVSYMARAAKGEGGRLDLANLDLGRSVGDAKLVRDVLFVPPSMPVATLLSTMKNARMQLAVVIDEFGGTDGLVSIEDAVETIVGQIADEHDGEQPEIVDQGGGVFVADAAASLDDVAEAVGGEFAKDRNRDAVETVGGMVFNILGRIPANGEIIPVSPDHEIVILDADQRRIRRLKIRPAGAEPKQSLPRAASRA